MRWDPKLVAAQEWFGIDFIRQLAAGETFVSANATAVAVVRGTDAAPANMVSGAAVINGSHVSQFLVGGVAGAWYRFTLSAVTSNGQTLSETSDLSVR